jgi:hypothetical protein
VPTHEELPRFLREYSNLTAEQQASFKAALRLFVRGLRERKFDPSLRVKRVVRTQGVWEMSWAPDGRATFAWGAEVRPGEPHIVWRRVGTHDIFREP